MNWFNILKNAKTVQSQRQGMSPIDIQKPFKRVKEEEDCRQKIIDEFTRICQKLYGKSPKIIHNSDTTTMYEVLLPETDDAPLGSFDATLNIKYPQNDAEKKAFCLFYDKFSKGKSFFPTMSDGLTFNEEKLEVGPEHYFTAWRRSRRTKDNLFIYSASLYDYKSDMKDLVEIYIHTIDEVDW